MSTAVYSTVLCFKASNCFRKVVRFFKKYSYSKRIKCQGLIILSYVIELEKKGTVSKYNCL